MKKTHGLSKSISFGIILCTVMVTITSCIDELYDLKNGISSEMVLGGDSLAIPLGSTDTIRLSDFLSTNDVEMLKTMEDGGYGLTMKDSISVDVQKINQESLKIDDQVFSQTISASFGDISLNDFKIAGLTANSDIPLNMNSISMSDFAIQNINKNNTFNSGLYEKTITNPTIDEKNINTGQNDFLSGINLPADPGGFSPIILPIQDPDSIALNSTASLEYSITVPTGVTNIDRIELEKNPPAVFEVSIEVAGASDILTAGTITPNIKISPSNLFDFSEALPGNLIAFGNGDALTASNGYKKTKTLQIDAFNITEEPLESGILTINKNIQVYGKVALNGAQVMSNNLSAFAGMDLKVTISINHIVIKSIEFDIPTLKTELAGNTTFEINNKISSDIETINKVIFNDTGTLSFDLKTLNLPNMVRSDIQIDDLQLHFPPEFVFEPGQEGLNGHTYTLSNYAFDPIAGKKITLKLNELNLSDKTLIDGKLNWNGTISYSGNVSFKGRMSSAFIPTTKEKDTKMSVDMATTLSFNSAEIVTKDITSALPFVTVPISLNVTIADQVKRLGVLNLTPGTMINIHLNKPELPLILAGDHIQIHFPPLFGFKQTLLNNIYPINGELPDDIQLELATLNINKDLVDGKLNLDEEITIQGNVSLLHGVANSKDIETLNGKKMSMVASTSDITITATTLDLKTLESFMCDTTKLNLKNIDLPAEIVALDSITLEEGATIQLSVDIANMPKLSNPLLANLVLNFPSFLRFDSDDIDTKNQWTFNQAFNGNKLEKTIKLKGLHFDGKNLNGKLAINEDLNYNVGLTVQNPSVNSEELNSNPIEVKIDVKLTGIKFKSVYGKVNPEIEPITTNIKLADLPEFMKGEDVVLDITKPVIALETRSNLGIPINADMLLIPIKNNAVLTDGRKEIELKMPRSSSASMDRISRFWIAPDSAGMPKNYEWIDSEIQKLFTSIPDEINFIVNAHADPDQQHFIDLSADYKLKVKYEVTVPMAFGKDLAIEICDTLTDLDPSIGEVALSGHKLELFGTIFNSIPLDLMLTLTPMDINNKPISDIFAKQLISAGAKDGSAISTDLSIKLEDPKGLLKDVRGFELRFKASSNETVAGTPIKPENFVKAVLKIRLNGGVNIGDK